MSVGNEIDAESVGLMTALLARTNRAEVARVAFRRAYPDAPQEMIDTAVFHVFVDGIGAAVDWLAEVERFLREPKEGLDHGVSSHLLYHLYNWQQFEALLPMGKEGLKDHLGDIRLLL